MDFRFFLPRYTIFFVPVQVYGLYGLHPYQYETCRTPHGTLTTLPNAMTLTKQSDDPDSAIRELRESRGPARSLTSYSPCWERP